MQTSFRLNPKRSSESTDAIWSKQAQSLWHLAEMTTWLQSSFSAWSTRTKSKRQCQRIHQTRFTFECYWVKKSLCEHVPQMVMYRKWSCIPQMVMYGNSNHVLHELTTKTAFYKIVGSNNFQKCKVCVNTKHILTHFEPLTSSFIICYNIECYIPRKVVELA